jgi:predicted exporter
MATKKNIAVIAGILLLGVLAWILYRSSDVTVVVNGQKLVGPAKFAAEGWGILVAIVSAFCAAILLIFVFAGSGLVVLGALVMGALLAAWLAFPFMLPVLIPLLIVWIVVAAAHGTGRSGR